MRTRESVLQTHRVELVTVQLAGGVLRREIAINVVNEGFGKFSACGDFRKKFPKTAFTAKKETQQSSAKQVKNLSCIFLALQQPAKCLFTTPAWAICILILQLRSCIAR